MPKFVRIFLVVLVASFCVSTQIQSQSFLDKLRKKTESVSNRVKKAYGKGCRKFRSDLKRGRREIRKAREKGRNLVNRAKRTWRENAPKLKDRAKKISSTVKGARERVCSGISRGKTAFRKAAAKTRRFKNRVREELKRRMPHVRDSISRADRWIKNKRKEATRLFELAKNVYGPRIIRKLKDPETRRKTLEIVGGLYEIHKRFGQARYEATYKILDTVGSIPVSGGITLEEMAQMHLRREMPCLNGTVLEQDPITPIAHLLSGDKGYFISEMPIVKHGGSNVTILNAMLLKSRLDPDRTIKCLTLLGAADSVSRTLRTGRNPGKALLELGNAIKVLQK